MIRIIPLVLLWSSVSLAQTWTKCADEDKFCTFSGTKEVRYGLPDTWVTKTVSNGTYCTNAVFSDPLVGKVKRCEVKDNTAPVETGSLVPAGYELVFSDDFNQPKLDTTKWFTRYIYSNGTLDFVNDEVQRYRENDNHQMTCSSLKLVAKPDTSVTTGISSGMIRSKVTFKYGYFEGRFKLPAFKGSWPAFWLNSDAGKDGSLVWPPEIDIMEYVVNEVTEKSNMIHSGVIDKGGQEAKLLFSDPKYNTQWSFYAAGVDLSKDWHTLGLLWEKNDNVSFYLDGKLIHKRFYKWVRNDKTESPYAHVLLNFALGGNWAGPPDKTKLPAAFEIDYVRVYQKTGEKLTGTSAIGKDLIK